MQKQLFLILILFAAKYTLAQQNQIPQKDTAQIYISGIVKDAKNHQPLPYASIFITSCQKGGISNEDGQFAFDVPAKACSDSVRFQYVGYETKMIPVNRFQKHKAVYLKEKIVDLSEMVVYGSPPDAEEIVEKVAENIDKNYKKEVCKRKVFMRERYTNEFTQFDIDYKKSSFDLLTPEYFRRVERKLPRFTTSFTDVLGNLYSNDHLHDSLRLKLDPIRVVSLKDESFNDMKKILGVFQKEIDNTGKDEFWKVRSGILGTKIQMNSPDSAERDSMKKNKIRVNYLQVRMKSRMKFISLRNDDYWDFIYNTGKYDYKLVGGTTVNNEDVYVIDFEPGFRANFAGRLYISTTSYALIRADYGYAPGKDGVDFGLFGVAYKENQHSGSVFFEKKDGRYCLKYFSRKYGNLFSLDRKINLQKKKDKFLFNKTQNQFKINLSFKQQFEGSVEFLVITDEKIPTSKFANFQPPEYTKIHYVDQFDEGLWRGYSIIEPTKQMREYRKVE